MADSPQRNFLATQGGEYIRWVQSTLNQLMNLRLPVDGVMGADTRGAIRSFQRREGLPEDGIVGPPTEAALRRAIRSEPSQDTGSVQGKSEEGEISRNTKDYVRWVQRTLNRALGTRLTEDGSMGPATRSAIRNFQKQKGLNPDGSVGPRTERALLAAAASPFAGASKSISEPRSSSTPFKLTAVESPGGGRIQDKTPAREADLVTVTGAGGKPILLHRLTAQAWQAMVGAARADGIKAPILLLTSGYRSPARQKQLWQEALKKHGSAAEARKWVAPPGGSPHQTGRAIDLHLGGRNTSGNVTQLRTLPAYKWLVGNARRFGFYPYEREPWHWEYNPPAR